MEKNQDLLQFLDTINIDYLINQIPGFFLIKDLDSTFFRVSKKVANYSGYNSTEDLIGLNDYTINHDIAKFGDFYVSLDRRLKAIGETISGFYTIPYNKHNKVCSFKKSFLLDKEEKKIGIITSCMEVESLQLANRVLSFIKRTQYFLDQKYFTGCAIESNYPEINLSERQMQCLYYLLRGKSASATAAILNLSKRTIETYIEEIKNKLGCINKSEIIELAITRGYIDIIPKSIKLI